MAGEVEAAEGAVGAISMCVGRRATDDYSCQYVEDDKEYDCGISRTEGAHRVCMRFNDVEESRCCLFIPWAG